ncbi:hypothetical protein AX14_005416, partial [Amanita brunnescens Koide BX004]
IKERWPSSPKPSAQLPTKQLTSPLLPLFAPSSAPRPVSTTSSAERVADGCPSPNSYWDQPDRTDWDFDNTIYCDSTGCSYDAKKNPRVAKYAVTVAEFDNCSYEEYNDTVFLCGQCNLKCLRKVNGSKIKSKIPIKRFLAQRDSEDTSDSFAVDALDLPLPPPTAADFPELPWAAPAPRMTKAEKAIADKINTLLLSNVKGKDPNPAPVLDKQLATPAITNQPGKATPAKTSKHRDRPPIPAPSKPGVEPHETAPRTKVVVPGILPIPDSIRNEVLESSPRSSGVVTLIMAMSAFHAEHTFSCSHDTQDCGVCRVGITCCKCGLLYTAPATKRMRCAKYLHWACDLDQSNSCCVCETPWVPAEIVKTPVPESNTAAKPAARFRGGAGSDNASDSSSARTTQEDSTVKINVTAPTQESLDEIDAFSHPSTVKPTKVKGKPDTRHQPKSGQSSREPSRPSSVASDRLSVAETTLHKPDYEVPPLAHEYIWTSPPADVSTLPGYIYEAHAEKTLHVDDDDVTHFVKRGDVNINDLSNQLDILLSGNSSWKTIYHAITDLFQFDSIVGTRSDFICLLIGLARSWDDDAECNPAGIVKTLINDASALVKTEEELHITQTTLSRIRNERNQAMTDVRKLVDTVDRLRKDRNTLKMAMEDIVGKGGVAPTTTQFEGIQAELALLKDENDRLNKVIEHDKNALRAAKEENTAFTLQVLLMNEDFDDKNAVIEALESASVEMMKEHGKLEIAHMSLKAELDTAMAVILTMKMHQESEQKVYESRISRLKARMDENPSTGSDGISKELAVAKERIAFLEKAYKEKSDALKKVSQSPKKPGPAPNTAKSTAKPDAPKWGFEPPDDLPRSQPYWDYRNAYSDHITAMVAATVTAIPHIPLSSAISTAMSTVSKAGPPPQLSKSGKRGQSGSSAPSRASSPAPSKSPPPVILKPSPPP